MDAYSEFLRLLGAPGAGLSALADAPQTVGLSALAVDPLGDATAVLEARRRQQVEGARAPAWIRDIGANIGNLAGQPMSAFIPPELRDRLPSAGGLANLVVGSLPGSGDYMAARDAIDATGAGISALGDGDYMRAGARGADALAAAFGVLPMVPFLGSVKSVGGSARQEAAAALKGSLTRAAKKAGDSALLRQIADKPIRAYHGSPHDFDRFDISKIGTGEGAQAYGHGLYFTQTEDVAKHYRDSLSREYAGGELAANISGKQILNPNSIQYEFARAGGDISAARRALEENDWRYLRENLRTRGAGEADLTASIMARKIQELESLRGKLARLEKPGRMYEVDIHADPSRFLDWDEPLSGQPREFSAAIHEFERNMGGPQSKMRLGDAMRTDSSLEDLAREAGIPGIKYLDRGSRMSGDGSRNYVVFDDKLIEILRKYGIMAPVAGAGLSALYLDGEEGM